MTSKYNGERVLAAHAARLRADLPGFFWPKDHFMPAENFGDRFLLMLWMRASFVVREDAEDDESLKQYIPYALIIQDGKILIYTRGKKGGEKKLHAQRSIGFGGHVNPVDGERLLSGEHGFEVSLRRELLEEVGVGSEDIRLIEFAGLVNEDSAEVGRVHLGLVYVVQIAAGCEFKFEDCLVDAELLTVEQLRDSSVICSLEGWSRQILAQIHKINLSL